MPIAATVLPVSTYVAVTASLGERLFDALLQRCGRG